MAYGIKYVFGVSDLQGNDYTAMLLQDGFVGSITVLSELATRTPISIAHDISETDIGTPIRPSTCTVSVTVGRDFSEAEFFSMISATNFEYKLTLKKNGAIYWEGYFKPVESIELNVFELKAASLVFVDGLTILQSIPLPYTLAQAKQYKSYMRLVYDILDQTGLDYNITYINELFPTADDTVPLWSYLSCVNANWLEDSGEVYKSCWDVLTAVMRRLGTCVYQQNGQWVVNSMYEAATAARDGMVITYGAFPAESAASFTTITQTAQELETNTRRIRERNFTIRAIRLLNSVGIKSTYGVHRVIGRNYNFDQWTGGASDPPDYWNKDAGLTIDRSVSGVGIGSEYSVRLRGYYNPGEGGTSNDNMFTDVALPVQQGDKIIPIWEFDVLGPIGASTPICRVSYAVSNTDGTYYLKSDGTWQNSSNILQGDDSANVTCGQQLCTIPITGDMVITVYKAYTEATTGQSQTSYYVQCYYAGAIIVKGQDRVTDDSTYYKFKSVSVRNKNGNVSAAADEPIDTFGYMAYQGGEMPMLQNWRSEGQTFTGAEREARVVNELADELIESGNTGELYNSLGRALANYRLRFYQANRLEIQGEFYGEVLKVGYPYTFNVLGQGYRTFVCVAVEHELRSCFFRAVLIEANLSGDDNSWTYSILPE